MDLEETKKIIESEIEAEALTRNVRRQIKSYIDQKQNLREGFKETFKPLIESQEAVKTSIDTQQNKLIEQLQKNQKALTEGLDKNRLAITSGFDKIDEVKRWDLSLLPGYEAIEEPEKEEPEKKPCEPKLRDSDIYTITHGNLNKLLGKEVYPDDDEKEIFTVRDFSKFYRDSPIDKSRYKMEFNLRTQEVLLFDNKPNTATFSYGKGEMDKNLNYGYAVDLLNSYGLKLPSEYKDVSKKEFHEAFKTGAKELKKLKKSIRNVAKYEINTNTNMIEAVAIYGDDALPKSQKNIKHYNIMQIFLNNMDKLRDYKEITGTGIIHFNNPHQLLDRLELLAGSIFAGNNGVKQEFSQFAHLVHQLKVITKKQLNDLLKKYILNK